MADMIPQGTQDYGVPYGHELGDANIKATTISIIITLSSVLVIMLAMAGMFRYLKAREMAKDATTPVLYQVRTDPPGPPLLPSPQNDKTPWGAYQAERREMEANAARVGLVDPHSGHYYLSPQVLSKMGVAQKSSGAETDQKKYFQSKHQWESADQKYTTDSSGGRKLEVYSPDGLRRLPGQPEIYPGMNYSSPPEPVRNGEQVRRTNIGAATATAP